MKLLIEIDEHNKNVIDRFANGEGNDVLPVNIFLDLIESVENGVSIPNNATNGDVLKIIFPDGIPSGKDSDDYFVKTDTDWWDAPYKGGE